jgi:predicted aminopeptidase
MKAFAEENGLKPTGSYTEYVDVGRPAVVWVVSACEPLGWRTMRWSFPIVGSVPYLGWFQRDDADAFAAPFRASGWDVDVRGASAYSTLGWFNDPVLSTMIPNGDEALGELANTVLHESVHATIYVEGQTPFNESVASFIADGLAPEYLARTVGKDSPETRAYLAAEAGGVEQGRAMRQAYERLSALYASNTPRDHKLVQKARILRELGREIGARRPINNATLVQFEAYASGAPELEALLAACGSDTRRLVKALRTVRPAWFHKAHTNELKDAVDPLLRAQCPAG